MHDKTRKAQALAAARGSRGFTLQELMITVAIVALLAAIAYPSYQEHVERARRADAKSALLDAAARMERFYFDNNTYTTDLTDLGYGSAADAESPEGYWEINAAAGPSGDIATSFTLTASLAPGYDDARCTSLTLDSRGQKDSAGAADAETCWR